VKKKSKTRTPEQDLAVGIEPAKAARLLQMALKELK
jgi:hypothetical protein